MKNDLHPSDFYLVPDELPVNCAFIRPVNNSMPDTSKSLKEKSTSVEELGISDYPIKRFYKIISRSIDLNSHE